MCVCDPFSARKQKNKINKFTRWKLGMLRGWQTTGTAACRLLQDADLPSRQKFFFSSLCHLQPDNCSSYCLKKKGTSAQVSSELSNCSSLTLHPAAGFDLEKKKKKFSLLRLLLFYKQLLQENIRGYEGG